MQGNGKPALWPACLQLQRDACGARALRQETARVLLLDKCCWEAHTSAGLCAAAGCWCGLWLRPGRWWRLPSPDDRRQECWLLHSALGQLTQGLLHWWTGCGLTVKGGLWVSLLILRQLSGYLGLVAGSLNSAILRR